MEKTAMQRMVGCLVIAALVIIILPLFSGKKEPAVQQVAAKTPAFPNEAIPASSNTVESLIALSEKATIIPLIKQPTLSTATPGKSLVEQKSVSSAHAAAPVVKQKFNPKQPPQQVIPIQPPLAAPVVQTLKPDEAEITPAIANDVNTAVESHVATDQAKTLNHLSDTADNTSYKEKRKDRYLAKQISLAKLTQSAWAIQMGNFKEKSNAMHLVDQLRSAGYKAFTREVKSSTGIGNRIRVYIGPEFKQATAIALSNKIQSELKLRGIIVTYKPLEL